MPTYAQALSASAAVPSEATRTIRRTKASRTSAGGFPGLRRPLGEVTVQSKNQLARPAPELHSEATVPSKKQLKSSAAELQASHKATPSRTKTWADVVVNQGYRTGWAPQSVAAQPAAATERAPTPLPLAPASSLRPTRSPPEEQVPPPPTGRTPGARHMSRELRRDLGLASPRMALRLDATLRPNVVVATPLVTRAASRAASPAPTPTALKALAAAAAGEGDEEGGGEGDLSEAGEGDVSEEGEVWSTATSSDEVDMHVPLSRFLTPHPVSLAATPPPEASPHGKQHGKPHGKHGETELSSEQACNQCNIRAREATGCVRGRREM